MAEPFIGQVILVPYNFAPQGWAFCNGQLLNIAENDALFALIGTTYGGDGITTFALPNLQSRVVLHAGTSPGGTAYTIGETGGLENVTLTPQQMPAHLHPLNVAGTAANTAHPSGAFLADGQPVYHSGAGAAVALNPKVLSPMGGNQPHNNLQPYLTLNWVISLFGVFPSQS